MPVPQVNFQKRDLQAKQRYGLRKTILCSLSKKFCRCERAVSVLAQAGHLRLCTRIIAMVQATAAHTYVQPSNAGCANATRCVPQLAACPPELSRYGIARKHCCTFHTPLLSLGEAQSPTGLFGKAAAAPSVQGAFDVQRRSCSGNGVSSTVPPLGSSCRAKAQTEDHVNFVNSCVGDRATQCYPRAIADLTCRSDSLRVSETTFLSWRLMDEYHSSAALYPR